MTIKNNSNINADDHQDNRFISAIKEGWAILWDDIKIRCVAKVEDDDIFSLRISWDMLGCSLYVYEDKTNNQAEDEISLLLLGTGFTLFIDGIQIHVLGIVFGLSIRDMRVGFARPPIFPGTILAIVGHIVDFVQWALQKMFPSMMVQSGDNSVPSDEVGAGNGTLASTPVSKRDVAQTVNRSPSNL